MFPVDCVINTHDSPVCRTANLETFHTLGSVHLTFWCQGHYISQKFFVAAENVLYPVIIGRDCVQANGFVISIIGETLQLSVVQKSQEWRALPDGWAVKEVVYDDDKLYIVAAQAITSGEHEQSAIRFYAGFNPKIVERPSRAEQLGALRPHKKLLDATNEAQEAAKGIFEQWISEGRLCPTKLTPSSSTTSWYVVGGDGRRHRPVFPFLHLNRYLKRGFAKDPFAQALISTLVLKTRCYEYVTLNDLRDAYMHIWILPSNWEFFVVNPNPFDNQSEFYAFHCLPYGPSHCPRVLELTLQWLIKTHMKVPYGFELWSYMDDLFLYAHTSDTSQEERLRELCEKYGLPLKPSKRQRLTEDDARALGLLFLKNGDYIALPPEKLKNLRAREPPEDATYADLLGTLGTLEESPVLPAWIGALKHLGRSIVARERASTKSKWSGICSKQLRQLIREWVLLVMNTPQAEYRVPRLYHFHEPLNVYTDAATHAGGFVFRQHDRDYFKAVYVFSSTECRLPIVCLEAHILYKAIAMVHQLEVAAQQRFDQVIYHVDNVAVEASFRVGRPAGVTSKDAKPIVNKYIAMTNALYDSSDFGKKLFVRRVSTQMNPADQLTRHPLLTKFLRFATDSDIFVCSLSSLVSTALTTVVQEGHPEVSCESLAMVTKAKNQLPSDTEIMASQHVDVAIKEVVRLLKDHNIDKEKLPSKVDHGFLCIWNTLLVRNDLLMRHMPSPASIHPMEVSLVPVLPKELIRRVLVYYHNPDGNQHPGIQRLLRAVKRYCWFPRMAKTVCEHIYSCQACRQQQLRVSWVQSGTQRAAPPGPWHTVAADTISISTPKGLIIVLTTLCLYSHWPDAKILPAKTSKAVPSALKSINSILGPLRILCTDRGTEFKGEVDLYLTSIGATHSTTLPFSPLASIEQLNRTILQKMQTVVYTSSWLGSSIEDILNDILWSLRSTPSSVHQVEPFTLMFGRTPQNPERAGVSGRAIMGEYVEDLLTERRASAMARSSDLATYEPGSLVFVRLRQFDRRYKVARRWQIMRVLRQEGVKVYLIPYADKISSRSIVERHVRECLPVPSGFSTLDCERRTGSRDRTHAHSYARQEHMHIGLPVQRPALNQQVLQQGQQQGQQQAQQQVQNHGPNEPYQQGLYYSRSGRLIKKPARYGYH